MKWYTELMSNIKDNRYGNPDNKYSCFISPENPSLDVVIRILSRIENMNISPSHLLPDINTMVIVDMSPKIIPPPPYKPSLFDDNIISATERFRVLTPNKGDNK